MSQLEIEVIGGVLVVAVVALVGWFWRSSLVHLKGRKSTPRIFAQSDSAEFRTTVERLMRQARRIVLIGTGLNILQRDTFAMEVMGKAKEGNCHLEVYLADPTSPAVQTRLIEEESGKIKPSVGQAGLLQRIATFLRMWQDQGKPETAVIRLFTHYPTFALIIIDDEYFVYPYGYATLGNFSPVLWFSKANKADQPIIEFLDMQYRLEKADALDAEDIFNYKVQKRGPTPVDKLQAFALYFVPPLETSFYQFGSGVLGYDVRDAQLTTSRWQAEVGRARGFGFHLTICDALYFLNKAELRSIWEEVEFITAQIKPFSLIKFHLEPGFPDSNSVAILLDDPSGTLELLHHELVHRVYRRAIESDYTLGTVSPREGIASKRSELMLKWYKAPYILNRFRPHFTLLTNSNPEKREDTILKLASTFENQVSEQELRVEKLAIMGQQERGKPWMIEKEVSLG